jgi:putative ABC transport system ATP-binding protein
LLATARLHQSTLVIATHDARVAALIPLENSSQIGFKPLRLLRNQLLKNEQIEVQHEMGKVAKKEGRAVP